MQLAKNNNAMWRVISNGDQPLPHLLPQPDLSKYQESQFRNEKAAVSPEKLFTFIKPSDLKRPWPMELLIKSTYEKKPAISLANNMFM